ncbi:GTPase Der [Alphaproteobacteria bacterium]|nr:GTPase Der [Alphaproteobacteria bacterium]
MTKFVLVGRTNAGKSTLFNRLARHRAAIVHATANCTRDRQEETVEVQGRRYTLVDTAGLEAGGDDALYKAAWRQTSEALAEADAIIFMFDAREPLTSADRDLARKVREASKPVLLVAGKVEGAANPARYPALAEADELGLGAPVPISAEHNEGVSELAGRMAEFPPLALEDGEADDKAPMSLAVVGRPNVGKSTLVNAIIGRERVVASPIAGTTRDAVAIDTKDFRLIDTAGQRKRAGVVDELEKLSCANAREAMRYAHVAVLVVDATASLDKQDLMIASDCVGEGRALVVALNKWDAVPIARRKETLARFRERFGESLHEVKALPLVPVSALKGTGVRALAREAAASYKLWNGRVPTGRLNKWFEAAVARKAPPLSTTGRRINLKYITQIKARPPQFVVFTSSRASDMPESYLRYLAGDLARTFGLDRVPVRLALRKAANPYAGK